MDFLRTVNSPINILDLPPKSDPIVKLGSK